MTQPARPGTGLRRLAVVSLILLAAAAAAAGLRNGFAYDDVLIIRDHARVRTLADPLGFFTSIYWPDGKLGLLYRPLGLLLFALEWKVGAGQPFVFHAVNLVLIVAVTLAVFALGLRIMPLGAAWLSAALFAVHPVHVEVTANGVGQLELVVALIAVLSVWAYVGWRRQAGDLSAGRIALLALGFGSACLVKDNAFMLPGLLLAAEGLLIEDHRPIRVRARALAPAYVALAVVGVAYLAARTGVTHSLAGDVPPRWFAELNAWERFLTVMSVVVEWVRLLVWPEHLAAIHSPPELRMYRTIGLAPLLGLAFVALGVATFMRGLTADRRVSFALAWMGLTLFPASNLVLVSGVVLSERGLFLPSVGAMLLVGLAGQRLAAGQAMSRPALRVAGGAVVGVLLGLGIARSTSRQRVWRDSITLFRQTVADVPDSFRAHWAYASQLFTDGRFGTAEREMRIGISLHEHPPMLEDLAYRYQTNHICRGAIPLYQRVLQLDPSRFPARINLIECLLTEGDTVAARAAAQDGVRVGTHAEDFQATLVRIR